jgi:hypothetical protein
MALKTKTLCFSVFNLGIALFCHAQQPEALPSPALIEHNLVNVGMIFPHEEA